MKDKDNPGPSVEGQNPFWPGDEKQMHNAGEVIKDKNEKAGYDETTTIPEVR